MSRSYLGIDLGTQGVKAIVLDPARGVQATASAPLGSVPGLPPGHSEQDPAEWLAALRIVCAAIVGKVDAKQIAAVGVSGQQHGFVPLDADGAVIRPAKLWNDVSSAPECAAIVAAAGGETALFERTGNRLPPGFTAGKIRWLAEHEPANFDRLRLILLPHDWVDHYLTGRAWCEAGDASGTGMFDVRARRFAPDVCAAVGPGIEECLPPLIEAGDVAGTVRAAAAAELGIPAGIPVSAGGGDNMMAAIGAGAVESGIAVMSLGTSGTVFACADRAVCDPDGEIAAFCDSTSRWLPLGCTMNATVSTELTRAAFSLDLDGFEARIASATAGASGVLCLPFFTGERSPDLPTATGGFLGLRPDNFSPETLARAAAEGATFALCRLLDRLRTLGVELRELRLTGGGSQSPTWTRIVASASGLPVRAGAHPDSAALGAAIHALWTDRRQREPELDIATCRAELGLDDELTDIAPDEEWREVYAERREAYDAAVTALTPVFDAIRGGQM